MLRCLLLLFTVFATPLVQAQIHFDGNINESYWGMPLATATGGPMPCINNIRLNSLFATATDSTILIGIGGMVQPGYPAVLFIDSKTGGTNSAGYSRSHAPACLRHLPAGTTFDAGFQADYGLVISQQAATVTIELLDLHTGSLTRLATLTPTGTSLAPGCQAGMMPATDDFGKGYEISIPHSLLGYTPAVQPAVGFMALLVSNDGELTNQFLTHAAAAVTTCLGKGANGQGIRFQQEPAINPVTFNPSRILPIAFIHTQAFQVGQVIGIFWTAATEKDMLEYQVERSADALQFSVIGRVTAQGNSSSQRHYQFADAQPLLGKNFYRIKAVDRNGRSIYSAVLKIQYGRVDNTLTIFPNPVKDQINLQITGLRPDTCRLQVFNDIGQCLIDKQLVYTGGYGIQQIPLRPNMMKGPYRLLLRNKGLFFKQNFLVQ